MRPGAAPVGIIDNLVYQRLDERGRIGLADFRRDITPDAPVELDGAVGQPLQYPGVIRHCLIHVCQIVYIRYQLNPAVGVGQRRTRTAVIPGQDALEKPQLVIRVRPVHLIAHGIRGRIAVCAMPFPVTVEVAEARINGLKVIVCCVTARRIGDINDAHPLGVRHPCTAVCAGQLLDNLGCMGRLS